MGAVHWEYQASRPDTSWSAPLLQCALSFQLATAPEVSEEEAGLLGPDWASPAALAALQARAAGRCGLRAAWLGARIADCLIGQ